jgi:hypothetical protein
VIPEDIHPKFQGAKTNSKKPNLARTKFPFVAQLNFFSRNPGSDPPVDVKQKTVRILTKRLVRNPPDVCVPKNFQQKTPGVVHHPISKLFSGVGPNWFNQVELLNSKFINQWKTKPSLIPIFGGARMSNKLSDRSPTYVVFARDKQETLTPPVRRVAYCRVPHVY